MRCRLVFYLYHPTTPGNLGCCGFFLCLRLPASIAVDLLSSAAVLQSPATLPASRLPSTWLTLPWWLSLCQLSIRRRVDQVEPQVAVQTFPAHAAVPDAHSPHLAGGLSIPLRHRVKALLRQTLIDRRAICSSTKRALSAFPIGDHLDATRERA